MLVVFEGIDKSGKATLSESVYQYLNKNSSFFYPTKFSFPEYETTSGKMVTKFLKGGYGSLQSIHYEIRSLLYASNRCPWGDKIRLALGAHGKFPKPNNVVICDRYVTSQAHQSLDFFNDPFALEKYFRWVEELEFKDFGMPRPDLVFLIDVSEEVSMSRGEAQDLQEADKEHLRKTRSIYKIMAEKEVFGARWEVLDGTLLIEDNMLRVVRIIRDMYSSLGSIR